MHLIHATSDFTIVGIPRPGFPIVLWENMESCWEANEFLRYYLMRGTIQSKKSWELTARALYDYFSFLEVHGLRWDDVSRGEKTSLVTAYRLYCFDVATLAQNTVRQRIHYVCEFYEYALREGWTTRLPFDLESRLIFRPPGFLAHVYASGGRRQVRSVMPRKHKEVVEFLSKDEAKALLGTVQNRHHEIIIGLALGSGLRREELASFPLSYVFDPEKFPTKSQNVRLTLDPHDGSGMKTKGSRKRDIVISQKLMRALFDYAKHWRGERASRSMAEHTQLFLNQDGQPWSADGKGIEAMVRALGRKVGLTVHPHMLRHTYATHTLSALQQQKGDRRIEPLVFLQKQLGHASIYTTMIYLHLVNEHADDAVLAYDDELNDYWDVTRSCEKKLLS